jgi:hypothetical protein
MKKQERFKFPVDVTFAGVKETEQAPETVAYAFDRTGKLLDTAPVKEQKASLSLPEAVKGRTVRVLLGPPLPEDEEPRISVLRRREAYERRIRVELEEPHLNVRLPDPVWRHWWFCPCTVRGRLIKRETQPDGTVRELPICHARVSICEVDRIPRLIWRLPDPLVFRLRDEILVTLGESLVEPMPDIPIPKRPISPAREPMRLQEVKAERKPELHALRLADSPDRLRRSLIELSDLWRRYVCYWDWLYPFFYRYDVDCLRTVEVDEEGRFETTIWYPCFGDKPDLYFKAEQLHGGTWETIYEPSLRCNIDWNYECGKEVVLNVTDPSAVACVPDDPVDTPEDVSIWIMPFSIRGTKIWGNPSSGASAPAGWVKQNGYTDYGGTIDAPFGGTLAFRMGHAASVPTSTIAYYRWSYRKGSSGDWVHMDHPVFRHYVKDSPGELPSFPAYKLGPNTVNGESDLFEFKPHSPPAPDPGDPSGTITYWPTDNFAGDIHVAFWNTRSLGPSVSAAAGKYQVRLEVFDENGNQVNPGSSTFDFIVPKGVMADHTILSRAAQAAEILSGAFVFDVEIDNNQCTAIIDRPRLGTTAITDKCGFLRYPDKTTPLTIEFHAQHLNNHATFDFRIVRGHTLLPNTRVDDEEVDAAAAGPYSGDGSGNFDANFQLDDLLCGPADPTDCCSEAAFAERLYVRAKATNGAHRLSGYDDADLRAFALAKKKPSP